MGALIGKKPVAQVVTCEECGKHSISLTFTCCYVQRHCCVCRKKTEHS